MNNTTYRIAITLGRNEDAKYHRTAYVAKRDGAHTWDGSWYTERELEQVKTWKTRAGASRWLAERPLVAEMHARIEEWSA